MPGEVFVHRNVANVVLHTDLNCQATGSFAVPHHGDESAWSRAEDIQVHGWIYGIHDGLLRNLGDPITSASQV